MPDANHFKHLQRWSVILFVAFFGLYVLSCFEGWIK
jgi:hypothetical protein